MNQPSRIWIDLDNSPHVPFFKPIIRELRVRGHAVHVSARDAFQVCSLAALMSVECEPVGRHYGKSPLRKVLGLLWRSAQLLRFVSRAKPTLALSHGSRSQILLCNLLRIPTIMLMDYEHAKTPWLLRPRWEIVPHALGNEALQCANRDRILTYPGIKEDVYASEFAFDTSLAGQLGLRPDRMTITVRPPANEAHYHSRESDTLFAEFMSAALERDDVQIVLLPRNASQLTLLKSQSPAWFGDGRVIVPQGSVDGLSLIWLSDLVVSGGGTMNREAAALGVPVYSIFRGPIGAVDRQLQQEGRLILVESTSEVRTRIRLTRRQHNERDALPASCAALSTILQHVEYIASKEQLAPQWSPRRDQALK
jgi:uncharacterized protein